VRSYPSSLSRRHEGMHLFASFQRLEGAEEYVKLSPPCNPFHEGEVENTSSLVPWLRPSIIRSGCALAVVMAKRPKLRRWRFCLEKYGILDPVRGPCGVPAHLHSNESLNL